MRTGKKEREEGQREEAKKTQKKETKKEQKKEQKKGLKKEQNRKRDKGESPFRRAAMFLYKQACVRKLPLFASRQVESDLVQLHPGENIPWIRTEYYVKKLSLTLVILFVGFLFGAAAKAAAGKDLLLQEDGGIPRGNYLDGEREIQVTADLGDYSQEFTVNLHPRLLTDEELETLWKEFEDRLPEWIKGENENLQRVTEDLVLQESYDGFPFQVEWESDRPDVLGSDGAVGAVTEQTETDLRAKISCQDFIEEMCIRVTLVPPQMTPRERQRRTLEEYLTVSEEQGRGEDTWFLPGQWEDRPISWSQKVKDNSILLWIAALVVAVLVYLLSDRDLHQKLEKRKKSLQREYPDVVHRLTLYVGAGMTVRSAFLKIASDYEKKGGGMTGAHPAYEEMVYTCRELKAGVSEGAAYEHFGRRTGRQEYVRLSALLVQNLKRGSSTLLERLREEAEKAGEEKLMQSRRLGEEAGTKLLIPMVIMLAVVMVMIMAPAFSTM